MGVQDDWLRHSEQWLIEQARLCYTEAAGRGDPFAAASLAMLELGGVLGEPSPERARKWLSASASVGVPELHPTRAWPSMKRLEALFAASRWRLMHENFLSALVDEFGISQREAQVMYNEIDVDHVGFVEWSGVSDRSRSRSVIPSC
jgi:hypothetical protein